MTRTTRNTQHATPFPILSSCSTRMPLLWMMRYGRWRRFLPANRQPALAVHALNMAMAVFSMAHFISLRWARSCWICGRRSGVPGVHRLLDSRLNGRYPQALWSGGVPFPVDFVLGAALMVRGEAIRQVGGLDDGYWMYCEEMDWCMRLRAKGWAVYAVPAARVVHLEGQSSRQRKWASFVRLWRSRFRFYERHRSQFSPGQLRAVRALLRVALAQRRRRALHAFAAGECDGAELAAELAAYDEAAAQ